MGKTVFKEKFSTVGGYMAFCRIFTCNKNRLPEQKWFANGGVYGKIRVCPKRGQEKQRGNLEG